MPDAHPSERRARPEFWSARGVLGAGWWHRGNWLAMALLAAAGGLVGCVNMTSLDHSVDRLVKSRSDALGGGAIAPRIRPLDPEDEGASGPVRDRSVRKHPSSVNPSADDLLYKAADTDPKKVLERLESYVESEETSHPIDLEGAFRSTQLTGREYRTAEEDYLLTAIRLLVEQHRWGPRLFDDISANTNGTGFNSDYTSALTVINELRATQRLPYGGEVEAKLLTSATQQLTGVAGDQYTQASQLVLSANIPLLRGAGLVAQEDLIQAERNLIYAARDFESFRRAHLVDIARDYFALVAQRSNIESQAQRLRNVERLEEQTTAFVESGRQPAFRAANVRQNVLTSRNALISSREDYILSLDRFKVRLGLPVESHLGIQAVSLELPEPDVSVSRAAELALEYRLDYQNSRDRDDDARRAVENARNGLLPDLNIIGNTTLNTDKSRQIGKLDFDKNDTDFAAGIVFSLPLDREIERLNLRAAMIQLQRAIRETSLQRDTIVLEARRAVREIDRARNSLELLSQAIEINRLRLEELHLKAGSIDPQEQLDAENELLRSQIDYDVSLRDLRVAILGYLLTTGQLRVAPDGTFKALQGMIVRMTPASGAGPGAGPGPDAIPSPGPGPAPDPGPDPAFAPDPGAAPAPAAAPGNVPVAPEPAVKPQ